jgi:hypothetical protein
MQPLSEIRELWLPEVSKLSRALASKKEDTRRLLELEPLLRSEVDTLVLAYSESLAVPQQILYPPDGTHDVSFLFLHRLQSANQLAEHLEPCKLKSEQMDASAWIQFLAIDSWSAFQVHRWKSDVRAFLGLA